MVRNPEIVQQRLALDEEITRQIVDDDVGEIRLPVHRTDRGKFWTSEPHDVAFGNVRISDFL